MKNKLFLICNLLICNLLIAQSINTTLGPLGVFTIKDASTNYFTLSQSTGQVNILKTLRLENTTNSTTGVIYKGADRFLHNYGLFNTFLGINSGNFAMTGGLNSVVGYQSLVSNTSGSNNSVFGCYSLLFNTTGYQNSVFGNYSLFSNTTGYQNSAFGYQSLTVNTTGSNNTAFGFQSLYSNDTGSNNTAFGVHSLYQNSTGDENTAVGLHSLYLNTTGYKNSAFGSFSLFSNSSGNFNSAFGYGALSSNTTGSNNTAIGYVAQVPNSAESNQVRIGNFSVSYAGIQVAWTITSDRRWKSDIQDSKLGLDFIYKLKPVSYYRNNDESKKTEYGFIAQEVEEVLKEEGATNSGMLTIDDNGMYELRYNDLLAPMVKAIQELSEGLLREKAEKDTEIAELKSENELLKERLSKFEQIVNELTAVKHASLTENK